VLHTSKSILLHCHRELISLSNAVLARPRIMVSNRLNDLDNMIANLRSFNRMFIQSKRGQVTHYDGLFKLMSPANILKRGFAIVYQDGHIINNAQSLQPGSHISVVLQDASLEATITAKNTIHEPGTDI
jgi:exodeoxyribonuclease VII large subunit